MAAFIAPAGAGADLDLPAAPVRPPDAAGVSRRVIVKTNDRRALAFVGLVGKIMPADADVVAQADFC